VNSFEGIAECAFAPRAAVMPLFESLESHREEKPRDCPKLVNAAPEKGAAGLNKDVPLCVHDSARKPADLRVQERLSAANPDDRSGAAPNSVQASVGGQQLQIRNARTWRIIAAGDRRKVQNQAVAGRASQTPGGEADR
jgi:hypothetical protein